jgi:hypothetical protein
MRLLKRNSCFVRELKLDNVPRALREGWVNRATAGMVGWCLVGTGAEHRILHVTREVARVRAVGRVHVVAVHRFRPGKS